MDFAQMKKFMDAIREDLREKFHALPAGDERSWMAGAILELGQELCVEVGYPKEYVEVVGDREVIEPERDLLGNPVPPPEVSQAIIRELQKYGAINEPPAIRPEEN